MKNQKKPENHEKHENHENPENHEKKKNNGNQESKCYESSVSAERHLVFQKLDVKIRPKWTPAGLFIHLGGVSVVFSTSLHSKSFLSSENKI